MKNNQKVTISKDGPYIVSGTIPLKKEIAIVGESGEPEEWKQGETYPLQNSYALCRCGESKNKPFCDGTHITVKFEGTETASRKKYMEVAEKIMGSEVDLTDAREFCVSARFCHLGEGIRISIKNSHNPVSKKNGIQSACNCPSGRLVVWDKKTKSPIEPEFEPSISLIEDPQARVSGPIWLKGNIPLESGDGTKYETRNRVTICRCGKSNNKPYCNGSHIRAKFNDGDSSLK